MLLGDFSHTLHFDSTSEAIEQPPPSAPAALFFLSLLGVGTHTHPTDEQQRPRCHISLAVFLNYTSSTLSVRRGLQYSQALYLKCFPIL